MFFLYLVVNQPLTASALRDCKKKKEVYLLTRAQCAFETQTVEIVTLAVFAPHLTKLICMA